MVTGRVSAYAVPMTPADEDALLTRAGLALDATALGRAVLAGDFDEARFRARLILRYASLSELSAVGDATQAVLHALGRPGSAPSSGIGGALIQLSQAIDTT